MASESAGFEEDRDGQDRGEGEDNEEGFGERNYCTDAQPPLFTPLHPPPLIAVINIV